MRLRCGRRVHCRKGCGVPRKIARARRRGDRIAAHLRDCSRPGATGAASGSGGTAPPQSDSPPSDNFDSGVRIGDHVRAARVYS
jgi:hypothetical protein